VACGIVNGAICTNNSGISKYLTKVPTKSTEEIYLLFPGMRVN